MKKFGLQKFAALTTAAALLLTDPLTSAAYAASNSVKVSLPTYPVQINGGIIDSSKAQYPPIVYKDITYLPLTWDYTRSLSLEYTWSDSEGLHVNATGNHYQVPPAADKNSSNKKPTYTAELVNYPVFVNNKPIDNQLEEYPLLSFRDITYFPMTWHFMHDEFYMNLFWNPRDGFAVVGPQRHYLDSFVNDSADYLYLYSGLQTFKIGKSLTDQPTLLTEEESQKLSAMPTRSGAEPLSKAEFISPDSASIERKEKTFYYKGHELLSLMPADGTTSSVGFMERSYAGLEYKEAWLDLGTERKILSLVETDTNNQILPDFSTYYRYFFVDGNERPVPLNEFTHWPISSVQPNPNGTWWLTSRPIAGDYINGRNGFIRGELSLLQPNGQSVSVNRQLKIDEIEVLSHQEDGTLIFRAYTRTMQRENPAFGIYKIDTSGNLVKLNDLFGQAYVSSDGDLWATDRYINRIVNITKNMNKLWMDYEFPFPDNN
ncbi:hypothetical protein [Paenibacillus qinlingensis]|uniref:Uncharacterized protein n=1 Tax=Paenibacillus qinlingensis TaxID=1837343 RepID=A0ABU1P5Q5_9BACL|nr:hypothetical protein [Paenibacillus qinlingensis]MDR6555080.1 hypothetical protein [Paenibacillus qinlingensis]